MVKCATFRSWSFGFGGSNPPLFVLPLFFVTVLVAQLADRPLHTRKALGSIPSENFSSNLNRYAGGRGIDTPILQSGELAQMVERPLSI